MLPEVFDASAFRRSPDAYPRSGSPLLNLKSVVQQSIELGPDLILFGAGNMAIRAFLCGLDLSCRRLRLVVSEVEIAPSSCVSKALRIFDRYVCAIERAWEESTPGRLGARSIRVLGWERQL